MKMHKLITVASLTTCIGLVGCSSGSNDPDPNSPGTLPSITGTITQLGFVSATEFAVNFGSTPQIESELSGIFVSSDQPIDAAAMQSALYPSADSCEVETSEETDFVFELPGIDTTFTTINAGEVITVTSPAGTYSSMEPLNFFGIVTYANDDTVPGTLPSGLTLDIPGDQFPAFSNVEFPPALALTGVTPELRTPVTPTTTYTWTPSGDPTSLVNIYMDNVDCIVLDDGSFTLPAEIQSQLDSNFGTFGYNIGRANSRIVQSGTSLLLISSGSDL